MSFSGVGGGVLRRRRSPCKKLVSGVLKKSLVFLCELELGFNGCKDGVK